ncbi:MAG: carbamate kinase [Thaumarchaeota archaeon]|nr:carbamate kinase [Nitrososphaerota archaeon]
MPGQLKVVVALGGNALAQRRQRGTYSELVENVGFVCEELVKIIDEGHQLVITHGNGPQAGNIAVQQSSTGQVPEMPLHVIDAMTQGQIGYIIQRELGNSLRSLGSRRPVVSLLTQVLVDLADPAFGAPSKPIGPYYDRREAERIGKEMGFLFKRVGRGEKAYRRVVPSPDPKSIVESDAVSKMLASGAIVIAGGGGGIPVAKAPDGAYFGVDAVVDKDLCAEKIAESTRADSLLILTDVSKVKSDFGTPKERDIDVMTVAEAKKMLAAGQFPPGSMGPKVTACVRFVEWGGKPAAIGPLNKALRILEGAAGTRVVP